MTVVVRDAEPGADAPAGDAIMCADIYAHYVRTTAISFEETPPTSAQMAARMRESQLKHAWLVAEQDGEICGYAYAHAFAERPAYRWACELSVYVAAAAQRRGVGRELYLPLLKRLTDLGYRSALAGITQPNEASNALHAAMGFEQCAVYRGVGFKHGNWHDVAWFQRPLGPGPSTPPSLA